MEEEMLMFEEEKATPGLMGRVKTLPSSPVVIFSMFAIILIAMGFVLLDFCSHSENGVYSLREKTLVGRDSEVFIPGSPGTRSVSESSVRSMSWTSRGRWWNVAVLCGLTVLLLYFGLALVGILTNDEESALFSTPQSFPLKGENPETASEEDIIVRIGNVIPALDGCYITKTLLKCPHNVETVPEGTVWSSTPVTSEMLTILHRNSASNRTKHGREFRALLRTHPLYIPNGFSGSKRVLRPPPL